jgi:hypothetical protein
MNFAIHFGGSEYVWGGGCTMGGPKLMKYFHILMPHNLLMQIEGPNNIINNFNIAIKFVIEFGCVGNGVMFYDVRCHGGHVC